MSSARPNKPLSRRKTKTRSEDSIQHKVRDVQEPNGHPSHLGPHKAQGVKMVHWSLPALLSWGAVTGLIFGGCCSNVRYPDDLVRMICLIGKP